MSTSTSKSFSNQVKFPATNLLLLLFWLLASTAIAADAYFLKLAGKGTASIVVSKEDKIAFITDGGEKSTGIVASTTDVDGQRIFKFLADAGVENLVITCSHPHNDHLGGLAAMIQSEQILTFKSLTFVDSGVAPDNKSLDDIYTAKWGSVDRGTKVNYIMAKDGETIGDVLSKISFPRTDLEVDNLPYTSTTPEPHGNSIISMYTLKNGTGSIRIVDFDDANESVISQLKPNVDGQKIDYVIAPHHGSDLTDISPLLESPNLKGVIFTVDSESQFDHPGVNNLKKAIEAVGIENVHLTAIGNAKITPDGLEPMSHRQQLELLAKVIDPRIQKLSARAPPGNTVDTTSDKLKMLGEIRAELLEDNQSATPAPVPADDGTGGFFQLQNEFRDDSNEGGGGGGGGGGEFKASLKLFPRWGGIVIGNDTSVHSKPAVVARIELISGIPTIEVRTATNGDWYSYSAMTPTELWCAYKFVQPDQDMEKTYSLKQGDFGLLGMTTNNQDGTWDFGIQPAIANTKIAVDGMKLDMVISSQLLPALKEVSKRNPINYQWYDEEAVITPGEDNQLNIEAASEPREVLLRCRLWREVTDDEISKIAESQRLIDSAAYKFWVIQRKFEKLLASEAAEMETNDSGNAASTSTNGDMQTNADEEASEMAHAQLKTNFDNAFSQMTNELAQAGLLDSPNFAVWLNNLNERLTQNDASSTDTVANVDADLTNSPAYKIDSEMKQLDALPALNMSALMKDLDSFAATEGISSSPDYKFQIILLQTAEGTNDDYNSSQWIAEAYEEFAPIRKLDRFARVVAILNWINRDTGKLPALPAEIKPDKFSVRPHFDFAEIFD